MTFSGRTIADFYPLDPRIRRIRLNLRRPTTSFLEKLLFNFKRLAHLRGALKRELPDVLLSFMDSTNVLAICASVGMPHRIIVSERNDPVANTATTLFWRVARRYAYRHSDRVVAQTNTVGHWLTRECCARVSVIPNALRSLPLPEQILHREPLVVAIGNLSQQKGFDLLLSAFSKISYKFPDWRLVILGEGPERNSLELQRSSLGLDNRVEMPGRVTDVESWLKRASLMVQPSRFEGFPNVILEGMGMGVSVISSDCRSGPREIICHRKNGLLVAVEDIGAIAAAMAELMSDPLKRTTLGRAALVVREIFSQENIMPQWEAVVFD